jgi:hypothetical protein
MAKIRHLILRKPSPVRRVAMVSLEAARVNISTPIRPIRGRGRQSDTYESVLAATAKVAVD